MATYAKKTKDKSQDKPEPQEDALESAHRAGLSIDADFLHLVMAQIQVTNYLGSDAEEEGGDPIPGIPIPLFSTLRLLCVIDSLYQLPDAEILPRVKVSTTSELASLRKNPQYPRMLADVRAATKQIAGMKSMDEVAETTESRMAMAVAAMATRTKGSRERMKALEAIVDRRSQKKSRKGEGGGGGLHLHFPPSVFAAIQETHRVLQGRGEMGAGVATAPEVRLALPPGTGAGAGQMPLSSPIIEDADEIDGSVVNVPLPGSDSDLD